MKFGDYLREAREQKGWTQPEAAAQADIEQSYLSKLETGRSYPSEDVFGRLAGVYDIDAEDMVRRVASPDLDRLREIRQVRAAILERHQNQRVLARGWLVAGLVVLLLGGACLGLTRVERGQPDEQYRYMSMGALGPEWPLDAYDLVDASLDPDRPGYQELLQRQQRLIGQIDIEYRTTPDFRGDWFVEQAGEGRRYFSLIRQDMVVPVSPLRWFLAPAFMFLIAGPGAFFVSFRWG